MGYVVTQGQNLSPEDPKSKGEEDLKSKGEEGSEGGVLSMEKLVVTEGQDLFPQDEESLTEDLSGTNMHTLPQYIFGLVALQKLLLRNCEILMMELPPEIGDLKNLEVLDLEGTEILCLPMEIAKLVNLTCLKVSFYGYANQTVIPKTVLSNLSRLKELIIDVTPYGEWWDVEVKDIIDDLRNLKELTSLKLSLPTAALLEDLTLILPGLANFRFTVGRHEEHFISRLPRNVEEEFNNQEKLEKSLKFINGNCIPNEITKVLKHANAFFLQRHWTAESLSEFGHENLNEVKFFLLMECNEFRTIIDSEKLYQGKDERAESEDFPDFDEAMVLGSLQRLIIRYMKHMESIWKGPVAKGSLSNLKSLALHTCPKLTTLFTIDMLSYLINLEELIVEDCPKINSLVSHQNSGSKSVLFLPSLKKISLLHLPGLVSISSGQEIAPKLERMVVFYCPKLKLSATEVSSKELKVIKGDKEWWDALKWYESDLSTEDEDYLASLFIPLRKDGDLMAQLTEDEIAGYGQGEVGSDCLSNFSEEELLEEISSKELEEIPSEELEETPSNPREIEDGPEDVKLIMVKTLAEMELTDLSKSSLLEDGVLHSLLHFISHSNSEMKRVAVKAIQNLSSLPKNGLHMIREGVVGPLLDLLCHHTSSPSLREQIAATIVKLATSTVFQDSSETPVSFLESDGDVSRLFSLISLTGPTTQQSLLRAFHVMCQSPSATTIKTKLNQCSAVEVLFPLCELENLNVRANAVKLLCCLTEDGEESTIMEPVGQKSIETFLRIIKTSNDEEEIVSAIGILSNLPKCPLITNWLLDAGGLPVIFNVLSGSNRNGSRNGTLKSTLIENAVGAICHFSDPTNRLSQKKAGEIGVIHVLVQLLETGTELTKKRAAFCLSQFSASSPGLSQRVPKRHGLWCFSPPPETTCSIHQGICTAESSFCLVEADAVGPLVRILRESDIEACEAALDALMTLIEGERLQSGTKLLAEANAIPFMIKLLTTPSPTLQEKVLFSLERIFRLVEYKQKYGSSAQMPLVDLTQRGNSITKSLAAKILAHLNVLLDQSSYF